MSESSAPSGSSGLSGPDRPSAAQGAPAGFAGATGTPLPPPPPPEAVTIKINGREVSAIKGEMLITAAERAGDYIPRFCYHPRMKPVGMCRMCLIDLEGPRGAALTPACFTPVADGQSIVTDSPRVKKAQDGILEFLLINHPLDCPVCDKGGECPLQDQTLAYGPGETRFVEEKRHWDKPIPISGLVNLDRERCIQCSRCTPLRRGGGRRPADRLRRPGGHDRGGDLPRRAVQLLLQRQHRADLPGRRPDLHAVPVPGPAVGHRPGREQLHLVRGRLPGGGAVELGRGHPLPRRRQRPRQLGLAVRQGPLRLRGAPQRGAPHRTPGPQRRRAGRGQLG